MLIDYQKIVIEILEEIGMDEIDVESDAFQDFIETLFTIMFEIEAVPAEEGSAFGNAQEEGATGDTP